MNNDTLTLVSIIVSGIALVAAVYAVFTAGKVKDWRRTLNNPDEQPENLEQIIGSIAAKIKTLQTAQTSSQQKTAQLEELLGHAVQHTGIVRFNALADEGGNLSFSLALLDAHYSGVVITSLHGRQQNRIYAKPIVGGTSEVPLSEEEQNAVFSATKMATTPEKTTTKPTKAKTKRTTKKH